MRHYFYFLLSFENESQTKKNTLFNSSYDKTHNGEKAKIYTWGDNSTAANLFIYLFDCHFSQTPNTIYVPTPPRGKNPMEQGVKTIFLFFHA